MAVLVRARHWICHTLRMSRPRVALWIAAVLVLFGIFVGLAPYFEVDGWGPSYAIFILAAFPVAYALLDRLASSYRRRHVKR